MKLRAIRVCDADRQFPVDIFSMLLKCPIFMK